MKHLPNLLIVDDTPENMTFLEVITKNIDVRMPGMNGYDLALKMNEDRLGDKVPVIFLTARQQQ